MFLRPSELASRSSLAPSRPPVPGPLLVLHFSFACPRPPPRFPFPMNPFSLCVCNMEKGSVKGNKVVMLHLHLAPAYAPVMHLFEAASPDWGFPQLCRILLALFPMPPTGSLNQACESESSGWGVWYGGGQVPEPGARLSRPSNGAAF